MNPRNVYILEDRSIIFVTGNDCKEFLQNLISNDINKVNEENSCFASLLTPQGKYLYSFIVIKHKSGYFIDCEKSQSENFLKQLNIYKLRSEVEIINLTNEFVVAAIDHDKFLTLKGARDTPGNTIRFREDIIFLDPRNKNLGARLIINLEKLYLSLKKLDLKNSDVNEYYTKSFELGIVPLDSNMLQNKIFGIECNFEELNALDFKKGCYIGQENTARIKLKNKLLKRLLPIELLKGNLASGESIYCGEKEVGKVLINGKYPFALIRFHDVKFDENVELECENAIIKINKPKWLQT